MSNPGRVMLRVALNATAPDAPPQYGPIRLGLPQHAYVRTTRLLKD